MRFSFSTPNRPAPSAPGSQSLDTVLLASLGGLDHAAATMLVAHPANALALAMLVTVGLWHGTLGLQVVIEDYITIKGGRQMALMAMRAAMAIIGLATLWAVSRIAL